MDGGRDSVYHGCDGIIVKVRSNVVLGYTVPITIQVVLGKDYWRIKAH